MVVDSFRKKDISGFSMDRINIVRALLRLITCKEEKTLLQNHMSYVCLHRQFVKMYLIT